MPLILFVLLIMLLLGFGGWGFYTPHHAMYGDGALMLIVLVILIYLCLGPWRRQL